jgi:hypothetical protein
MKTFTTLVLMCAVYTSAMAQKAADQLPLLDTSQVEQGYVNARGRWDKDLYPKNSEMEITCVKAQVSQLSNSSVGFCLMALGFTMNAVPNLLPENNNVVGVSTNYYDIVSWGKTRIIAEKSFPRDMCPENRQLVIDFPSNIVTLTSTVSMTEKCVASLKKSGVNLEPVVVYSLIHAPLTANADKQSNPFLREK